jgi:hypothetical protein
MLEVPVDDKDCDHGDEEDDEDNEEKQGGAHEGCVDVVEDEFW